jgi:hypothetical protein
MGNWCESAWGPDADRRAKLLIHLQLEGSLSDAYSQLTPAEAPLIEAEILFRQPGPAHTCGGCEPLETRFFISSRF